MTESPPRSDERGPAVPHGPGVEYERIHRAGNRLLVWVLAMLIFVLCVLVAYLLKAGGNSPAIVDAGPIPSPLLSISGPGKGDAPGFARPLSAAWGPNGDIYVSDTGNSRVCVFSGNGGFVREFGGPAPAKLGASSAVLRQPGGISVGSDGRVYVADIRAGEVVVFDSRGRFVKGIHPNVSGGTQQRWTPTDVTVSRDRVYVTDGAGVAIFSADGSLLGRVDAAGGTAFSHPNGVALRPGGSLVISDTNNRRVVSVDGTGSLVWAAGPVDAVSRIIGLPRGLSVSRNGSVLIADAFLFGVTRLSEQGTFIERYGERGSELGRFEFPNDVDVRGDLVLVADKENNRVQVIRWPGLVDKASK